MTHAGIHIQDVQFSYGSQAVIHNMTITIPKGEFVLVVGPNGSGKTTWLRIVAGLLEPTAGHLCLDGISPKEAQMKGLIHLVPQIYNKNAAQFPATVEEVVGLALFHVPKQERKGRILEALELVGMQDFLKRRIGELSGGQQQRVMLAQALARKPNYILLDEPTSGIDYETSKKIYEVLRSLKQENITVIMVTHDVTEAMEVADTILCVDGHACYYGPCKGFMESHQGSRLAWHIGG